MKNNLLFFILPLFSTIGMSQIQRPYYINADSIKKIPYGEKQPSPEEARKMLGIDKQVLKNAGMANTGRSEQMLYDLQMKAFQKPGFEINKNQRTNVITRESGSYMQELFAKSNANLSAANKKGSSTDLKFHLTKDINALTESFPYNVSKNNYTYPILDNVCYFRADDGIHGRELWRSDGTTEGTYMLKDIIPGETESNPTEIIEANGRLYFSAATISGNQPFTSDGTEAGTHLLKDLSTDNYSYNPRQFIKVNSEVFFITDSYFGQGNQLWKTDGTEEGTVAIKYLSEAGGYSFEITQVTAVNGLLFFTFFSNTDGRQLWRSDGSADGTFQVKLINQNTWDENYSPLQLTAYNNKLYFSADDGTGRKLWVSDGTEGGTGYAAGGNDIFLHTDYLSPYESAPFKILNGKLYLSGFSYANGSGLYNYDESDGQGIVLVEDLTTGDGIDFVSPPDFTIVNDALYFKVISNINGWHDELWITDGLAGHAQLLKTFEADAGTFTYNFYDFNGALFFNEYDAVYGAELWKSDGTNNGTRRLKDIYTGAVSSRPLNFTTINGKLLLSAVNASSGRELWIAGNNEEDVLLLKDINTTSTSSSDAGLNGGAVAGDALIFPAYEREHGTELYRSDGSTAGTSLVGDLTPGENDSYFSSFTTKLNDVYYLGYSQTGGAFYKVNGTTGANQKIFDISNGYVNNYAVADNGTIFYVMYNYNNNSYELWSKNGNSNGLLTSNLYYNNGLITAGNTAFFNGGDDEHGFRLWKSDGTVKGTKIVPDAGINNNPLYPYSLFAWKNEVYFGAYDGYSGDNFYKSNGFITVKLKDVHPPYSYNGVFYNGNPYCISGNNLFLAGIDRNYTGDLYKTNGAPGNTTLVKKINPDGGSEPSWLTDVNGKLFFIGTSGETHPPGEIFSTDGSAANTRRVHKTTIVTDYQVIESLCNAGGKLYFLKNDITFYPTYSIAHSIWNSDGTEAGTSRINDPVLNGLSYIGSLIPAGNKIFFGGYNYKYGTELYVGDLSTTNFIAAKVSLPGLPNSLFTASLNPNPARDKAVLKVSGDLKNINVSISDIAGKMYWKQTFNDQNAINLPVEKLVAGTYVVTVKNPGESKSLILIRQ